MAKPYFPSLRNLTPKVGLNQPSGGVVAGAAIGESLAGIAQGLNNSQAEQAQIRGLISAFGDDPDIQGILRAQANAVPLIGSVGGGSGGGGRGSSGSAIGSEVFSFALQQADAKRRQAERIEYEGLQNKNAMDRIGASFRNEESLIGTRLAAEIELATEKDALAELINNPGNNNIQQRVLETDMMRAEAGSREADASLLRAETAARQETREHFRGAALGYMPLPTEDADGNVVVQSLVLPTLPDIGNTGVTSFYGIKIPSFPGGPLTEVYSRGEFIDYFENAADTERKKILRQVVEGMKKERLMETYTTKQKEEQIRDNTRSTIEEIERVRAIDYILHGTSPSGPQTVPPFAAFFGGTTPYNQNQAVNENALREQGESRMGEASSMLIPQRPEATQ